MWKARSLSSEIIWVVLWKLNPLCDSLFRRPKKYANVKDTVWYDNMPLGHNKIGGMMKEISKKTGLSTIYTNHCIRATTTTVLFQAGLEGERITNVTGHHSTTSLKPYIKAPTQHQKRKASEIIGKYAFPVSERQMAAPSSSVSSPEPATAIRPTINSVVSSLPLSTLSTGLGSLFAGATLGSLLSASVHPTQRVLQLGFMATRRRTHPHQHIWWVNY